MTSVSIQLVLCTALIAQGVPLTAGWMSSPLSWSVDSQWLSYTVVSDLEAPGLSPRWLFETPARPSDPQAPQGIDRQAAKRSLLYRIWTTAQHEGSSVLLEQSRSPLTAPSWSPRGKSIAFGRFVTRTSDPDQSGQRGSLEIVVQTALDSRKTVWSSAVLELDAESRALIPRLSCSWSADQSYLAVPLPTPQRSIVLIDLTGKKRAHLIPGAILPVWAPDGSKCVYIRRDGTTGWFEYIERRGSGFSDPRPITVPGVPLAAPVWSPDGRAIYGVVARSDGKLLDVDLTRCALDNRELTRHFNLVPDGKRRTTTFRGITIDFTRDAERCFFSLDFDGNEFELVSGTLEDHELQPRLHPLDVSQRIGALAVSPDSRSVAVRFGGPDELSPPAVFHSETEQTVILVPDELARKDWRTRLVTAATRLLSDGLPPAAFDGQAALRPSLLPLPGEVGALGPLIPRLDRIAKRASPLYAAPERQNDLPEQQAHDPADLEARLFFDYLRARFRDAAADLDALDAHIASPQDRLGLLSLRAQILWAQGHRDRARFVIDYLLRAQGTSTMRVEETPLGLVGTKEISPSQAWARYLSSQSAED